MPDNRRRDHEPQPMGARTRFPEIDLIRGFMLISMALNHGTSLCREMGRHAASPITIAQVLPSTTTEIFFLLSGYLVGHVRLAKSKAVDRVFVGDMLRRTWQLYAYNAVTLLAVAAFMSLASPTLLSASRFDHFVSDPFGAVRDFMLLRSAPFGFDVLQVYIIFFLTTPLFASVLLRWPSAALAWLATCWIGVEIWSLTIGLDHDETIGINLWAWQVTFFGGMVLGVGRRYAAMAEAIVRNPVFVRVSAIVLLVLAFAWLGEKYPHRLGLQEPPWTVPGVDRMTLGPLKIVSSLGVIVVMIWLACRYDLASTRIGRAFVMLGRHSLTCFCATNFGLYGVGLAWQASGSHAVFWLAEALYVAFVFVWVAFVDVVWPANRPIAAGRDDPKQAVPAVATAFASGIRPPLSGIGA